MYSVISDELFIKYNTLISMLHIHTLYKKGVGGKIRMFQSEILLNLALSGTEMQSMMIRVKLKRFLSEPLSDSG